MITCWSFVSDFCTLTPPCIWNSQNQGDLITFRLLSADSLAALSPVRQNVEEEIINNLYNKQVTVYGELPELYVYTFQRNIKQGSIVYSFFYSFFLVISLQIFHVKHV